MALPSTVETQPGTAGHYPPCKSSGGSFYAPVLASSRIKAYKADGDDPADAWTIQDSTGDPAGTHSVVSTVQDGDVIHVATYGVLSTVAGYRYHQFNMATDTWDLVGETIEIPTNLPTIPWISIAVRSDGTVVVVYAGDTDQVMGGTKERVDVNIRETDTTWSGPTALDAAGDIHYGNPNCVLGTNDFVHCVWQKQVGVADPPTSWSSTEARSIDPADDGLSTVITDSTVDTAGALLGYANIVSYDDGGTQRIIVAGRWNNQQDMISSKYTEDVNDEIAWHEEFARDLGVFRYDNGEVSIISFATLDTDIHVLFSGGGTLGADQDLYYLKSTDDGTDWVSQAEEIDAITVNFVSANIYVRGADTVMAYVYDDGGVQKYNEKVLIAGAVDLILPPMLHSFARTRAANY